jgi:signal peptidase I
MIPKNNDFLLYHTWGSSMFPLICGGDYILVKKVSLETIQPGDTIVFAGDNKNKVCHRLVEIKKKDGILWFYTQGYKDSAYDAYPVRQEKVLGKVVVIKRKTTVTRLSTKGLRVLLLKLHCFLTEIIFYLKKILAKIPFLKRIYRYIKLIFKPYCSIIL